MLLEFSTISVLDSVVYMLLTTGEFILEILGTVCWGLTCWPQAPRSSRSCAAPCWRPRWSQRCQGRWGGVEGGSSRRWPPPTQWWWRRDVAWRRPVAYRTLRTHRALLDCAATLDGKHWNTERGPLGAGSRSRSDNSRLFTRLLSSIEPCHEWSIFVWSNTQYSSFFLSLFYPRNKNLSKLQNCLL